jgi:cytochrome c556
MKKRIILTVLATLMATTTSLSAADFDLRANMYKLNLELTELQRGFMLSDQTVVSVALQKFSEESSNLLADDTYSFKKKIYNMFPKDMKNKKHKVTIAMKEARKMDINIKKIQAALNNKNDSILKRKRDAQAAYQNILGACFECHNLVRDKK